MKFWTFQTKERCELLFKGIPIVPDWSKPQPIKGCSMEAYRYILDRYNHKFNSHDTGLIFGYVADTWEEVVKKYKDAGSPSGAMFPEETHVLLELELPDYFPIMEIDFYRFSDLMFYMEFGFDDEVVEAKKWLFVPNSRYVKGNNVLQFPVSHIPCIKPDWVVNRKDERNG